MACGWSGFQENTDQPIRVGLGWTTSVAGAALLGAIRAGMLDGYYWVDQFHRHPEGRNGGGDRYVTDRRLAIGVINIAR